MNILHTKNNYAKYQLHFKVKRKFLFIVDIDLRNLVPGAS